MMDSIRLSLIVDEYAITLQQAFSSRSIPLNEIKGYRIDNATMQAERKMPSFW
jgi:hypothetical protein